jgi:hypothetical protein
VWPPNFLKGFPMIYRGVPFKVVQAIDVQICWHWSLVINNRRKSGQTKISRRAAEIQARSTIDKALARQATEANPYLPATAHYRKHRDRGLVAAEVIGDVMYQRDECIAQASICREKALRPFDRSGCRMASTRHPSQTRESGHLRYSRRAHDSE